MSSSADRHKTTAAPLLITAGEPAGIGPDLCIQLAANHPQIARDCLIVADPALLADRARRLDAPLDIVETTPESWKRIGSTATDAPRLQVLPVVGGLAAPGQLSAKRSGYVLKTLETAVDACFSGRASAMVTAPVHKGVINEAGIPFSGHTEFLAERCAALAGKPVTPVMMLATPGLRVALVTTHLPLRDVADAITDARLTQVIKTLQHDLQRFGVDRPRIAVCGLNPHAGEDGHLGREEIEIIQPCLARLRTAGIDLIGPLPADTAFTPDKLDQFDAFLAMYHDQGLTVLKHKGFGQAVNVTLGLPILRTSVDHGTALDLAGSGKARLDSLLYAIQVAQEATPRQGHARSAP